MNTSVPLYFTHSPYVSWRTVGEYTLLVDHQRGRMITLSEVAGQIWSQFNSWNMVNTAARRTSELFDVGIQECANDVNDLIGELLALGLIISSERNGNDISFSRITSLDEGEYREQIPLEVREYCQKNNIPIIAFLELTEKCNLRCQHCYNAKPTKNELTGREFYDVLDQLAELGAFDLVLTGGEPVSNKHFLDVLEYAKKLHYCITVKSNGVLITKEHATEMANALVVEAQISLYSMLPDEHDIITQSPGSLNKTLMGINHLMNAGIPVSISCPVTKYNYKFLDLVSNFGESIGVQVSFDPIITPRVDGSLEPTSLRIGKEEWGYLQQTKMVSKLMYPLEKAKKDSRLGKKIYSPDEPFCGAGSTSIAISSTGEILPCIVFPKSMGNIRDTRLSDLWKLNSQWDIIRSFTQHKFQGCQSCANNPHCLRCPAVSLSESGRLNTPLNVFCETASNYSKA